MQTIISGTLVLLLFFAWRFRAVFQQFDECQIKIKANGSQIDSAKR